MRAKALTRALGGRWHGSYGTARCPAHDDNLPSLSIRDGEYGRMLLHCHAGCEFQVVAAAIRDRGHGGVDGSQHAAERPTFKQTDRSLADLININVDEGDSRVLVAELRELGGNHAAWAAPCGREINNNL